jgi:hypothetical protein
MASCELRKAFEASIEDGVVSILKAPSVSALARAVAGRTGQAAAQIGYPRQPPGSYLCSGQNLRQQMNMLVCAGIYDLYDSIGVPL